MAAWWSGLAVDLQVFYAIGILSTFILFLQIALMLVGFDHDIHTGDVDMGGPADHPGGLHILSIRTVVAFFVGFGWTGVIALQNKLPMPIALALSMLVGGAFMGAVFFIMKTLHGLRHSGTLDYKNAIGKIGSVYLPIPGNRSGPGQVEVLVQGRLAIVQAYTNSKEKIPNHTKVKVVDVVDPQTLLVEPLGN